MSTGLEAVLIGLDRQSSVTVASWSTGQTNASKQMDIRQEPLTLNAFYWANSLPCIARDNSPIGSERSHALGGSALILAPAPLTHRVHVCTPNIPTLAHPGKNRALAPPGTCYDPSVPPS